MSAYIEQGGNIIDTANVYTKGHSEKNNRRLFNKN
ncbi:aldo/keto reductase [Pedobacter lusitanus]